MNYIVIDVREPFEYLDGHIDGSLNIPPLELISDCQKLDSIPKNARIIVYCRTGSRSNMAMHILQSKGYKNIINGINKEQVAIHYGL